MDKQQIATIDLILSTMHLLAATIEGMIKLEHKPYARQLHTMTRTLSKDLDKVMKEGGQP